jgi:hypothetical protein
MRAAIGEMLRLAAVRGAGQGEFFGAPVQLVEPARRR